MEQMISHLTKRIAVISAEISAKHESLKSAAENGDFAMAASLGEDVCTRKKIRDELEAVLNHARTIQSFAAKA